ncbi:permease [Parahaliea aestuarii]|uniref:ATPase n=1 Tax=Parahaliea aestuarii TaxID=1852021 RepID=A0A5C8ZVQ7_9GAMM|nr:permease [Parahaliea aestuarii]TXS91662.1 ATPase [Parahaliea aestuarii]
MSDCHSARPAAGKACHSHGEAPAGAAPCHSDTAPGTASDGCCPTRSRPDYLLWGSLSVVALAYGWALVTGAHDHDSAIGLFTGGIFELFNQMWWGLALGVIFVGLLGRIPRDLVLALLGRNGGVSGLFRATFAGVFLDLCSHGILAVGMKLYERGATVGQVMAFLLASPWNSFSLTLILFGLIGVGWTLLFILISLVIGVVTGLIFDTLVARGTLPANPWREELGQGAPLAQQWRDFRGTIALSLAGTVGVLKDGFAGSRVVLRWALFGLVLAALIRALVPADAFATWFGASFAGLWLTLLAATVIEVCSEGATPIAADLMNRAAAPGNAFTFLMAGVATDYTELMSIKDTTRSWKLALFLPLVTVPQVMVIGFILNQFGG